MRPSTPCLQVCGPVHRALPAAAPPITSHSGLPAVVMLPHTHTALSMKGYCPRSPQTLALPAQASVWSERLCPVAP